MNAATRHTGTLTARINAARNLGDWSGAGITSSTARGEFWNHTTLGATNGADYQAVNGTGAVFDGITVNNPNWVIVKYTYYGDTDFSGTVDGDDYARADNGYNTGLSRWINGDADGNGFIDGDDYSLIDNAYNTQTGTL